MAWARLRGMPEARADFRSGQICAVLANVHRGRDDTSYSPADFVAKEPWDRDEEPPEMTPEQLTREIMFMLGKKD